jgi:alpha-tubulin suppressor-like RCC1 family protein
MTQINKSAVLSQLQSVISGLTVGSESTDDLLLLLKTAINAGESAENIVAEIESRVGSITTSNTVTELVYLIKALELSTKDRTVSVADVADLDAIDNLGVGSIAYVESESETYILLSTGVWTPLFRTEIIEQTKLWAWGPNSFGQLGDDTITSRTSPVSVVGGFSDWISASAFAHSLGVRANGSLWAWGNNGNGQLGDGTLTSRSSPVSVVGGFTDWISASAGNAFSVGVRANGTVWAWGLGTSGRLGDGTVVNQSSPVSVIGGFTDWISASAGNGHSLGVRANGSLWAWGAGSNGRLGDNTATDRSSPVSVVGGFTDWISASGGRYHSLGVRANGTLWAWGLGTNGRVGDGTSTTRSSPVSVVGGFTDWISASAGEAFSLGVRANGSLWAWGSNASGQLGDNTATGRTSPVSVVGGFTDWISASGGSAHSLGVRANGTLWAWGVNTNGRLGDDTTTTRSSPVSVVGGFTDWISASAGNHSFGIRSGS